VGALDEARSAINTYRSKVESISQAIAGIAQALDQTRRQLTRSGAMGSSSDVDLEKTRARLDIARTRFDEAARGAQASREPVHSFAQSAFPP
jgi:hypothetical protein